MYTHKQLITARIFVIGQILFKIQGFEIGEMEVEHPVQGQWLEGKHFLYLEAKLNKSSGFEVYPELNIVKNLELTNNCQPKANTTSCIINKYLYNFYKLIKDRYLIII